MLGSLIRRLRRLGLLVVGCEVGIERFCCGDVCGSAGVRLRLRYLSWRRREWLEEGRPGGVQS